MSLTLLWLWAIPVESLAGCALAETELASTEKMVQEDAFRANIAI
jgi:hypothetical protein